jgi:hypothetical protein
MRIRLSWNIPKENVWVVNSLMIKLAEERFSAILYVWRISRKLSQTIIRVEYSEIVERSSCQLTISVAVFIVHHWRWRRQTTTYHWKQFIIVNGKKQLRVYSRCLYFFHCYLIIEDDLLSLHLNNDIAREPIVYILFFGCLSLFLYVAKILCQWLLSGCLKNGIEYLHLRWINRDWFQLLNLCAYFSFFFLSLRPHPSPSKVNGFSSTPNSPQSLSISPHSSTASLK